MKTRIRVKALDPYGLMMERSHFCTKSEIEKGYRLTYFRCRDENCHATLVSKKVKPDPQGNSFGLYGCFDPAVLACALSPRRVQNTTGRQSCAPDGS